MEKLEVVDGQSSEKFPDDRVRVIPSTRSTSREPSVECSIDKVEYIENESADVSLQMRERCFSSIKCIWVC